MEFYEMYDSENMLRDAKSAQDSGFYSLAIDKYKMYLKRDPFNAFALNNLSVIYINQGNLEEAEKNIMFYLENSEGDASSFNHLAIVYLRTFRHHQAAKLLKHALILDPFKIDTYLNLVNVYCILKDTSTAMHYALEAIKIEPTSSKAFNNLGSVLNNMALFEEANIAFQTAYDLDNSNIESLVNLASIQIMQSNTDKAIKIYESALRKLSKKSKSHVDVIKFLLSFEYFKKGKLKKGYEYYDYGFHPNIPSNSARNPPRKFTKPIWDGSSLKDKTLLVWKEQGLGDEIMFLACLPDLIKVHKKVILEVDFRLVETMQRSFPEIIVRPEVYIPSPSFDRINDDYDLHIPVGSLMRYFRSNILDFKNSAPYIKIDELKKNKYSNRLIDYKDKIKIGICWRSGKIDSLRSLTYLEINKWGDLFSIEDVVWVNLQYGDCEDECLAAEKEFGIKIIRWPDLNLKDDLDDIFSLISVLDYCVTVTTAVHHMAAATGCETLLITPTGAWNRFNLDYDPWFNNLRPFVAAHENLSDVLPLIKDHIIKSGKK